MTVTSEISIYEIDGIDTFNQQRPSLRVTSHWNNRDMAVLEFEGRRLTIVRGDLERALTNAGNCR